MFFGKNKPKLLKRFWLLFHKRGVSMDKVLQNIRDSESEAKKIIKKAEKKKESIIAKARSDAMEIMNSNDSRMSKERDEEIREYKKMIMEKKKAISEKGKKDTKSIEEKAGKSIDK